jgi:hypothetical protein
MPRRRVINPFVQKCADEYLAARTAYFYEEYPSEETARREQRWVDAATAVACLLAEDYATPAALRVAADAHRAHQARTARVAV